MAKLPFPWNKVDWKKVRDVFEQSLGEPVPIAGGKGSFRYVCSPEDLFACAHAPAGWGVSRLIVEGLPERYRRLVVGEEDDVPEKDWDRLGWLIDLDEVNFESVDKTSYLLSRLEGNRFRKFGGMWLFGGWNPSSHCSGSWSVSVEFGRNRGYFFTTDGDAAGNFNDSEFIIAVFEPLKPFAVFREACIHLYCKNYEGLVLPPALGERAYGVQPLWMECLEELFRSGELYMPSGVPDAVDNAWWKAVKDLTGFSDRRLREYYRILGFAAVEGTEKLKPGEEGFRLELVEIEDGLPMEDPKYLRFLVANYCQTMETVGMSP